MQRIQIAIDRGDEGIRIDRVLQRHLRQRKLSRTRIQQLVANGAVTVNGLSVERPSWRVATGDRVHVELPEGQPPRRRPSAEPLPLDVLFEDSHLLIVNKPAGQVVHPAYRNTAGTLLNAALHHLQVQDEPIWTPRLLGRLDKFTSGVVIFTKTGETHVALQRAMSENLVEKDYLAVVHGRPRPTRGTIDIALQRDPSDRRRMAAGDRGGQRSITSYQVVKSSQDHQVSLVRCRLVTGRMHQIRVHLSAKGWPIVGDPVYGGGIADEFPHQALHSWRVAFNHPLTRELIELKAPIPADMESLIATRGLAP